MFDAYEVAIRLKVIDKLSPVMAMVSEKLMAANLHATALEKRLESIQKLTRMGVLATGAGIGLALTLKAATNEAVRYEQQMNKLKALNLDLRFGAGTTASLQAKADQIAATTNGISKTEALRIVTETQGITGDVHHTLDLAPTLAKIKFAMETYMAGAGKGEGHGGVAEKQFQDIVKVMEMRGLMRNFSEEKMQAMSDLFVKNFVASGGMVKPSDFLAMMKTGGVAAKSTSDDFMFALGHIMQEKGGNRAGTQLMSAYQNLIAGRSTQQVAENLAKLGLLEKDKIHYGKTGHITKVDPEGLKSAQMMIDNPLEYMNKMILPALSAKGVDINDASKVLPAINQLASNRTGADFLAQLYLERSQIANYMEQSKNAKGLDQLYQQAGESTVGKQIQLRAKLLNLEKAIGEKALPILVSVLEKLNSILDRMMPVLERHPGILTAVVYGLAGLAAALMISGPIMLLTAGIRGIGLAVTVARGAAMAFPAAMSAVRLAIVGTQGAAAAAATPLGIAATAIRAVGAAAGVLAAAYAGWKAGGWLNDNVVNPTVQKLTGDKNQTLGGWIYDRTHVTDTNSKRFGDFAWWRMLPGGDFAERAFNPAPGQQTGTQSNRVDPVRPAATQQPVQVTTQINLDGRKVAEVVTEHQARDAQRPTTGTTRFDGRMSPVPVGVSGRW